MQATVLAMTEGMSRDNWLAFRQKGIGGSDAAVACGVSRWKSPVELWMEKTGKLEAKPAGEAAYWGQVLEPVIRQEFTLRSGLMVKQVQAVLQHKRFPFMIANLDGMVIDPVKGEGVFEAKTANYFARDEWEDGIPDEYSIQVQHYLAVTGLSYACVSVLIGGNNFAWKYIERDQAVIDLIIQLEARFWKQVETNTPPDIDGSAAASELLNRLYPLGKKNTIELPEEALGLIKQYEETKKVEESANQDKDAAINQLKSLLGENDVGVIGNRKVSWITVNSERLDSKRLKVEQPELYQNYLVSSPYRRFSIK